MISTLTSKNSVRYWRVQLKMKQDDLARQVGINRAWLSAIETGKMIPTPELVQKICEVLGKQPSLVFDV